MVDLLPEDVQNQLGLALGTSELFVGIPLGQREAAEVVARLDGAAAEASAHLLGNRAAPRPPPARPVKRPAMAAKPRRSRPRKHH